jgi:predicted ATP-dependent endonuclease of OLD family
LSGIGGAAADADVRWTPSARKGENMHLSKIRILNYRSCKDIEFSITKYSVIVGYNNAGKSNALYAIQWLFNPTSLGDRDFNNPDKDIEVFGVIEGLNESFLSKLLPEHRERILPFITNEKLLIKRVLDHNNMTSKKGISLFVLKDTDKDFLEAEWTKNPTGIDNAIKAIFPDSIQIPAMSDAFEDSTKYATKTTMGQLVSKIIDGFKQKNETVINSSLKTIKDLVCIDGSSRSDELEKIDSLVSKSISEIFPGISAKLHITLPTIDDIFKGATLKTIEDGCVRDLDTLGHGTQRSIQMALIRSLRKYQF